MMDIPASHSLSLSLSLSLPNNLSAIGQNPEKVKQFQHFVNSDETDPSIVFVREREQIRPASDEERRGEQEDILATG